MAQVPAPWYSCQVRNTSSNGTLLSSTLPSLPATTSKLLFTVQSFIRWPVSQTIHTLLKCHSSHPLSYTVQNLFFTAPTPIASTDDLRSFCTGLLPQLPTFNVTPVTTPGSHGYCDYQSARGSFRSPSFTFTDGDTGKPLYCVLLLKKRSIKMTLCIIIQDTSFSLGHLIQFLSTSL